MNKKETEEYYNKQLLKRFNEREGHGFGEVYEMYFRELHYFTSSLYRSNDIDSADVIHDIFAKIWQDKKLRFDSLNSIKAYLYISIKNNFKNYLSHKKHILKYNDQLLTDNDYYISKIVESETYSAISHAINLLPTECAKVFKMVIEGWDVDHIAKKLNKSKSTIYEHKTNAVNILKRKLPKDKLMMIMNIIN